MSEAISTARSTHKADALGLTFSSLCILHCVALPLLAVSLPFAGVLAEMPIIHKTLAFLSLAATIAVITGCRPVSRFFLGAAFMGNAAILGAAFLPMTEQQEVLVTSCGAGLLVLAHSLRLLRLSR